VEEATLQPLSRVGRLKEAAESLLASTRTDTTADIENVLREIDANFTSENLPPQLAELRAKLMRLMVAPA
jgi:MoxR-like ATPase